MVYTIWNTTYLIIRALLSFPLNFVVVVLQCSYLYKLEFKAVLVYSYFGHLGAEKVVNITVITFYKAIIQYDE